MCEAETSAAYGDLLHNPDGIMLMYADSGHRRSRRHCGSRAVMAPRGGGGLTGGCGASDSERNNRQRAEQPTADCDRFSFNCGEGVRKSVADLF